MISQLKVMTGIMDSHPDQQVSFAGDRSQVIVLPMQKVSQTLLKANLRPKNVCLGLIRPKVSFDKCLGYFLYW